MLKDNKKRFSSIRVVLLLFSLVCLGGFIVSVYVFVQNQMDISDVCENAVECIASSTKESKACDSELVNQSIDYFERIQNMQEATKTNDVMAFIYTAVSSALIGLGVGLIASMYKKSKEIEDMVDVAKKAYRNYEKSQGVLELQTIYIEIVNAKMDMMELNKENAYERFGKIEKSVLNYTKKIRKYYDLEDEKDNLKLLHTELCQLSNSIEKFKEKAEETHKTRPKLVESYIINAQNCEALLDDAIEYCEDLIK